MSDLIDRQAAIKILRESEEYDADIPNRADGVRDAIIDIMSLPTIEVRKGKWIRIVKHYKDDEQEYDYYEISCSECGAIRKIGWHDARYCPNCGADMRGEDDEGLNQ